MQLPGHAAIKRLKYETIVPLLDVAGRRRLSTRFKAPPIVLGGCPRSGTTLLLSMLGAHPEIYAIPVETHAFTLWKRRKDDPERYEPARQHRLYRAILARKIPNEATRWCEKTPSNLLSVVRILDYFDSDVRFIHIVRDARDVCTSIHPKNPQGFWVEPHEWAYYLKIGLRFEADPRVFTVRYEDLVMEYTHTIARVCEFLGVACVDQLTEWHKYTNIHQDRAWFHDAIKQHDEAIGRWQGPALRQRVAEIMRDEDCPALLERLGYL